MDLLITIGTYILGFIAVVMTVGFIAWLFISYHSYKNFKRMDKQFNESWNETNQALRSRRDGSENNPFKDMYK